MNKNDILVIYGTDYQEMTIRLLRKAHLDEMIGDKNKRIGIKPNLVAPVLASDGGTTHPEVIEGLIRYLQENGFCNLKIMEGSWVGDKTSEAFAYCGYEKIANTYHVPLVDAQKESWVPVTVKDMELKIVSCAADVDFMINVPVMKGHCQTHITCALKNMKGLLPNAEKRHFHAMGLHDPIGHLALAIPQNFILVDSICGDLNFEDGGSPTPMDRIFCCTDPVLCDAYVCKLLDYEVDEVPYIRVAEKLGAGSADLANAHITELNAPVHPISLPDTRKVMKLAELAEEVESCSACYGYLIPALDMLDREGLLKNFPEKICIGQGYRGKTGKLGIGSCTSGFTCSLKGCPPLETEIYEFLKTYLQEHPTHEA